LDDLGKKCFSALKVIVGILKKFGFFQKVFFGPLTPFKQSLEKKCFSALKSVFPTQQTI